MRLSINETTTVALKACRGCQLYEGLAEDAARAVAWASERGLPGLKWLLQALRAEETDVQPRSFQEEDGSWRIAHAKVLVHTPSAVDLLLAGATKVTLEDVSNSELALSFAGRAAADFGVAVELMWSGVGLMIITKNGVNNQSVLDELVDKSKYTVQLRLLKATPDIASMNRLPSVEIPEVLYDDLNTLGARTYVEATDASRRLGAGAGLVDTD